MKKVEKFVCSVTGKEFDTEVKAIKHENMAKEIAETFSFWSTSKENNCNFANGEYVIKRDKAFYEKMQDGLDAMIRKYEPWIIENCEGKGQTWKKEYVRGYMVMRYLDDNGSLLYIWGIRFLEICGTCFRQHGQIYYATNCMHDKNEKT